MEGLEEGGKEDGGWVAYVEGEVAYHYTNKYI